MSTRHGSGRRLGRYLVASDAPLGDAEMILNMLRELPGANALLLQRRSPARRPGWLASGEGEYDDKRLLAVLPEDVPPGRSGASSRRCPGSR